VTGDDPGTSRVFGGAAFWRFGALAFTRDHKGLVFWGGVSQYNATSASSTFMAAYQYGGSIYACDLDAASVTVTNILPSADGGNSAGVVSYTTSSQYNPTLPAGSYTNGAVSGVIKPVGGFLSKNGNMYYLCTFGALSGSEQTNLRLVKANIKSVNTGLAADTLNGLQAFRATAVGAWPTRRGFLPNYYYFASYPIDQARYYAPGRWQGLGLQVMAKQSGWVFFGSHYLRNGPTTGTGSSSFGGPVNATYWADYGAYGGQIEGFHADIGGNIQRLTSFTGDTTSRSIHYIEPSDTGQELAFVYDSGGTQTAPSQERVHYVGRIGFNGSTGVLTGSLMDLALESGSGRAGESMAFSSGRDRLYYAFKLGSGNENDKQIVEAKFNAAAGTFTTRVVAAAARRYNVLNSGR
jgi:hypothetical protein